MECRTFWRYRDGALASLPLRDAGRKDASRLFAPGRLDRALGGRERRAIRRVVARAHGDRRRRSPRGPRGVCVRRVQPRLRRRALRDPDRRRADPRLVRRDALLPRRARDSLLALSPRGDARGADALDRGRSPERRFRPAFRRAARRARRSGRHLRSFLGGSRHSAPARATGPSAPASNSRAGGTVPLTVEVEGLGPDWDRSYSPAGAGAAARAGSFPRPPTSSPPRDSRAHGPTRADKSGSSRPKASRPIVSGPERPRGRSSSTARLRRSTRCCFRPASPRAAPGGSSSRAGTASISSPSPARASRPRPPCRTDGERETLRRLGARINAP